MSTVDSRSVAGALLLGIGLLQRAGAADPAGSLYSRCAKMCTACAKSCQTCSNHCAGMVKNGMKENVKSQALSADCADLCTTASRILTRKGTMARAACQACLESATACGTECRRYPDMKVMADCAKACADCVAACKEFLAAK